MGCWSAGRGERLRAFNTTRNVACVFDPLEYWPDTMGNGRVVDPPLPVIVDLASLFPMGPGLPNTQPLKITKGGLHLTGYATGELLAWARSSSGAWIACVRLAPILAQ